MNADEIKEGRWYLIGGSGCEKFKTKVLGRTFGSGNYAGGFNTQGEDGLFYFIEIADFVRELSPSEMRCKVPPFGWACSRQSGHPGPCAARSVMMAYVTVAAGIVFAMIRVWIGFNCEPTSATWLDVFKDMVHVYMGALGVFAWLSNGWARGLFWTLCVVEVAVAVIQRM